MSTMSRTVIALMAVAFAVLATACSLYNPKNDVRHVIVTGNYQEPRLMADLVLSESNQPYILVPNSLDQRIFWIPGSRGTPKEIAPDDFARFVTLANPKQIVILGDERYVPQAYEKALSGLPVIRVYSNNWVTTAERVHSILNLNNLSADYRRTHREMKYRFNLDNPAGIRMGDAQPYTTTVTEPAVPFTPPARQTVIEEIDVIETPAPAPIEIPAAPEVIIEK